MAVVKLFTTGVSLILCYANHISRLGNVFDDAMTSVRCVLQAMWDLPGRLTSSGSLTCRRWTTMPRTKRERSVIQDRLTLEVTMVENRPKCTCLCCNNFRFHHTKQTHENLVSLDSWQIFLDRVYFSLHRFSDKFFAVECQKHLIQLLPIFGRFYVLIEWIYASIHKVLYTLH